MAKMKSTELVQKAINIAKNYKTLYVMGCFGAPMNASNKTRYCNNHSYNRKADRTAMVQSASEDTFGFDCVCLIKGILWGWSGDRNKVYGGASYAANDVPDIDANQIIKKCSEVRDAGWTDMIPGELLWMPEHVGIYIGDGLAVECTPRWNNSVQITAVHNIGKKSGYNGRSWVKHGKLPYVSYEPVVVTPAATATAKLTVDGEWGEATTTRLQQIFGTPVDGEISNQWACFKDSNPGLVAGWDWQDEPNGRGSVLIKAMQKWAGMPDSEQDGEIGPKTICAIQTKLGTPVDGLVSYPSQMVKALQEWANAQ